MTVYQYYASEPVEQKLYNGHGVVPDLHEPVAILTSQDHQNSRRRSIQSMSQASSVSFAGPATPAESTPTHFTGCGYFSPDDVFWSPPSATHFGPSANWSCTGETYPYSSPSDSHPHTRAVLSTAGSIMNAFTRAAPESCTLSQELLPAYQDCSLSRSLPLFQTLGSNEPGWGEPPSLPSSASLSICLDEQGPHSLGSSQSSSNGSAETYNDSDTVCDGLASYQFGLDHGIDPNAVLASQSSTMFSPPYIQNDLKLTLGQLQSQWGAVAHVPYQSSTSSSQITLPQTPRSSRNRRSSKIKTRCYTSGSTTSIIAESKQHCHMPGCHAKFKRAEHLKRHEFQKHRDGEEEQRFKCALAIRGGKFTCTINNKTNSRKDPDRGGTERKRGIPRRDNHYQHYQTHLKHKDGKSRNRMVSKNFLYFCILKHNREDFANIKMRLEKAFARPTWPGFSEPDQAWMMNHPDYKHWLDVLAGGDALPEPSEPEVSTGSSCGEDDFFDEGAPVVSKICEEE